MYTHKHTLLSWAWPLLAATYLLASPGQSLALSSPSFQLYQEVGNHANRQALTSPSFSMNENGQTWHEQPATSPSFQIATSPPTSSSSSSSAAPVSSSSSSSAPVSGGNGGGRRGSTMAKLIEQALANLNGDDITGEFAMETPEPEPEPELDLRFRPEVSPSDLDDITLQAQVVPSVPPSPQPPTPSSPRPSLKRPVVAAEEVAVAEGRGTTDEAILSAVDEMLRQAAPPQHTHAELETVSCTSAHHWWWHVLLLLCLLIVIGLQVRIWQAVRWTRESTSTPSAPADENS